MLQLLLGVIALFVDQAHSEWLIPVDSTLPEEFARTAVGYNYETDIVSLMGGGRHLIEINMTDMSMVHFTDTPFSCCSIAAIAQHYTQLNLDVYIINQAGTNIMRYSLDTKSFSAGIASSAPPTATGQYGFPGACLAHSAANNELYVVGGHSSASMLQVFDLTGGSWSSGPNMQEPRRWLPCMVHPTNEHLFAIGGTAGTNYPTWTIEHIDSNNWQSTNWTYTDDFTELATSARAIVVDDVVWVIGGNANGGHVDAVHVIHADFSVTLHADRLAMAVDESSVVRVRDTLYSFGGIYDYPLYWNGWQYYELLSRTPTASPTSTPSAIPSSATSAPTEMPSAAPAAPTRPPTQNPSRSPSEIPSSATSAPSRFPSLSPTSPPTEMPTQNPSRSPSEITSLPTLSPTEDPTTSPIQEAQVDEDEEEEDGDQNDENQSLQQAEFKPNTLLSVSLSVGAASLVVCVVVFAVRHKLIANRRKAETAEQHIGTDMVRSNEQEPTVAVEEKSGDVKMREVASMSLESVSIADRRTDIDVVQNAVGTVAADREQEEDEKAQDESKETDLEEMWAAPEPEAMPAVYDENPEEGDAEELYPAPVENAQQQNDMDKEYAAQRARQTTTGGMDSNHAEPKGEEPADEGRNEYMWIAEALQEIDESEWGQHLQNFKTQRVTDQRVAKLMNREDYERYFEKLIPEMGIRLDFIEKCEAEFVK